MWKGCGDGIQNQLHLIDYLLDYYDKWGEEVVGLVCVIIWRIWYNRNQVVHGLDRVDLGEVLNWANAYLTEFK